MSLEELKMFNNNNHDQMGPRISFSGDFLDSSGQQLRSDIGSYKEAPVSSDDFEFSVNDYSSRLRPADEIFFQGKLLPGGNNCSSDNQSRKLTLREELQAGEDKPARTSSGRWMERLGLKKSRRSRGSSATAGGKTELETVDEETSVHDIIAAGKKQQEVLHEGRQSCSRSSSLLWMKTKSKDDQ